MSTGLLPPGVNRIAVKKNIYDIYNIYFTLLLPGTCFGSLYRSHLQDELYFLKKVMYTIDNTVIDCEISNCIFKILQIKII
jgi:hypothetical protein